MTDSMSGRARLSRNNINILSANQVEAPQFTRIMMAITYEFQYRLPTGQTVWRKTYGIYPLDEREAMSNILDDVRVLRRELERGHEN